MRRIIGQPLVDRAGERLGTVHDVVVRLTEREDPPVVGLTVRIGQHVVFVPAAAVTPLRTQAMQLVADRLDVRSFERRPREILLGGDLLGHHVISIAGARLVRVRDVELTIGQTASRAVAVVVETAPFADWFLRGRLGGARARSVLPWSGIEPLMGHVPSARWRLPFGRLARLHPARLADLLETASPSEGEEIIRAVGQDRDLEADVFEEMEPAYQVAYVSTRADAEVADLLATMAPDDAADLLLQLEPERRARILGRLPLVTLYKVRMLLGYNPATAGGLMSTDFLAVAAGLTVQQALDEARSSRVPPVMVQTIYVVDSDQRLIGGFLLGELLRRDPAAAIGVAMLSMPVSVQAHADIPEIALTMTDFNLTLLPVLDADTRLIGVIAVDDLLEVMLPEEWRTLVGHKPPLARDQFSQGIPEEHEPAD